MLLPHKGATLPSPGIEASVGDCLIDMAEARHVSQLRPHRGSDDRSYSWKGLQALALFVAGQRVGNRCFQLSQALLQVKEMMGHRPDHDAPCSDRPGTGR